MHTPSVNLNDYYKNSVYTFKVHDIKHHRIAAEMKETAPFPTLSIAGQLYS